MTFVFASWVGRFPLPSAGSARGTLDQTIAPMEIEVERLPDYRWRRTRLPAAAARRARTIAGAGSDLVHSARPQTPKSPATKDKETDDVKHSAFFVLEA